MQTQSLMLWALVPVVCLATFEPASAQPLPSRLQLGAEVSALRQTDLHSTSAGLGGRVSYDVFRWLSAEGEFTFFPEDDVELDSSGGRLRVVHSRQRVEAFGGPKGGIRRNRLGLFAKARPGFERVINGSIGCLGELCALATFRRPVYRTEFALNLGGVVEFYPSARTFARFDLGTTMIRHRSEAVPPCRDCTTRNVASSAGVGWRF